MSDLSAHRCVPNAAAVADYEPGEVDIEAFLAETDFDPI